ncbi:MAG: gamma-glutamyltransferase [Bryobacterales bacterium]|nr:gamma-glutamyltransferase [Bryobacterales bacterium]
MRYICLMRLLLPFTLLLAASLTRAQEPSSRPFWRPVVMGTHGMVAAEHPLEALAGSQVLQAGGNAFDAAVAMFYMTAVVEQHQAGIGGDAFILAYFAKEKRTIFINGTGPAPKLATREFYRKLGKIPDAGPLSSTVPGAVGAFDLALKKYGTLDYKTLMKPAYEAAAEGHPLTYWSASMHEEGAKKISPFPTSVAALLKNGKPFAPGDLFVQPDLAKTLRAISDGGADAFYRGPIARLIDDFYRKQGGLIRHEDLASYKPEEAEPIHAPYKDLDIYQCPPNSQGIVLLMALNIMEPSDFKQLKHNSPEYVHQVTEALKLAFADRDRYIADPRTTDAPVAALLSKDYGNARRALIKPDRAIRGAAPPGDPRNGRAVLAGHEVNYESGARPAAPSSDKPSAQGETSSFVIADKFGNVVSVTHSVNATFGSGLVVEGGGFVLNDRLPYFSLDENNVNRLEPGKRPRHTINPAIALKNGKPYLAWNTPGADNQPQAMLQAFLNVQEFGMNLQQALEAPTVTTTSFHASMFPQTVEGKLTLPKILADAIAPALAARGHRIEISPRQGPYRQQPSGAGAVKMVRIDPVSGVMQAGVSPAKDDYVIGW